MAEPHVLTGLIAKRAEIAGKIEHLQDEFRSLIIILTTSTPLKIPSPRTEVLPHAPLIQIVAGKISTDKNEMRTID